MLSYSQVSAASGGSSALVSRAKGPYVLADETVVNDSEPDERCTPEKDHNNRALLLVGLEPGNCE